MIKTRIDKIISPALKKGKDDTTSFLETPYPLILLLHSLVLNQEPEIVIETGSMTGSTSCAIAEALRINGKGKLIGFESNENYVGVAKAFITGFQLDKYVEFIEGDAFDTLPRTVENLNRIDFVYHDINPKHRYLELQKVMESKLPKGSIVTAHDTVAIKNRINNFLDYMNERYESINLSHNRGLFIGIKK